LRLFGRESIGSQFEQALVARRQQAFCFTASTRMEFQPEHFQQSAGLILYYHATKFHYLFLTEDDTFGRHLRVMSCVTDVGDSFTAPIPLPAGMPARAMRKARKAAYSFCASVAAKPGDNPSERYAPFRPVRWRGL